MKENLALLILLSLLNQTSLFWGNPVLAQKEVSDKQKVSNLELVFKSDTALLVTTATFSPDQKYLVTGTTDGTICFWDNIQGREKRRVKAFTDAISNIIFAPDGEHFLTTSAGKTAKLWKILSEKEITEASAQNLDRMYVKKLFDLDHKNPVTGAAFSPDGNSILTTENDLVHLWDAVSGKLLKSFKNDSEISSVGLSPDGALAVTTDYKSSIKLWDVKSGNPTKSLQGHTGFIKAAAFSPDGKTLATGGSDRTVKIWDVVTGRELITFRSEDLYIRKIMFSPDGGRLSIVDDETTVHIFNLRSRVLIRKIKSDSKIAGTVEFSPDGRYLIAPQENGAVSLISLETGKQFCQIVSFKDDSWAIIDHQTRFDASEDAEKNLEYKFGNETIALTQLKEMYYEPRLLAKLLGFIGEPLRPIIPLSEIKLYPEIPSQKIEGTKLTFTLKNRGGGIGKVEVFVNDKIAYADTRDDYLKSNPSANERTLTIDLIDSAYRKGVANKVKIVSSNYIKEIGQGNLRSSGTEIIWNAPGESSFSQPHFYAIVTGVSDYTGDYLDLKFPSKDAEDIGNALNLGAQRMFGKTNTHITVLSSSGKTGTILPTKANLKKSFEEVIAKAQTNDIVVVYLAGHAVTLEDTYLFLTQEASSTSREYISKNSSFITISSLELMEFLGKNRALKQVLILDTAAAGAVSQNLTQVNDISGDQIRAMQQLREKAGLWILMGAAANAVSYEANKYGQGLLTYSLLEGLKGAALEKDGLANVSKLFDYAQNRVPILAKDIGGIQQPQIFVPSNGNNTAIGSFNIEDRRAISLAIPKPIILKPNFGILPENYDELNLNEILSKKLADSSKGQESAFVFIDVENFPDALRPVGTYSIVGDVVKVKLFLRRDGKIFSATNLAGSKNKLDELADSLVAKISELLKDLTVASNQNSVNPQNQSSERQKTKNDNQQPKISIVPANEFFSKRSENSFVPVKFSAQREQEQTQNDSLLITPPVIRRKMPDGKEIADDIGLGEEVRKQTQKISENPATESKATVPVFLQGGNPKGAYRPQIIYTIEGKKFKAELTIHRDEMQVTDAVKIAGATDDLALLAELVVEMILEQVKSAFQTKGTRVVNLAAQKDIYDSKGRDFALFIANDEYDHLTDLQNPVDDVTAVAERLRNIYGFETEIAGQVVGSKKIVKTETVDEFYNEINALQRRQFDPEKDQLLVFISGHGDYDGDVEAANGIGYYAVKQSKSVGGDPNHLSYVNFENLKNLLNRLKCKHILLVIDSCFSGAIDESTTKSGGIYGEMSNVEYISKKMNLTTRKVLTSGELQYTWDGEKGKHSPFVAKFLESLDTFGNDDGILTTLEIYTKLEKLNPQPKRGKFSDKDENSSEFLFVKKRN